MFNESPYGIGVDSIRVRLGWWDGLETRLQVLHLGQVQVHLSAHLLKPE